MKWNSHGNVRHGLQACSELTSCFIPLYLTFAVIIEANNIIFPCAYAKKVKIMKDDDDMRDLIQSHYKLDKKAEGNFNFARALLVLSGFLEAEGNFSILLWNLD